MTVKRKYFKVPVTRAESVKRQLVLKHIPALLLIIIALSMIFLIKITTALADTGSSANLDSDPIVFLGNHRLPPMNYLKNDQAKGLTVEIVKAMAERMEQPVIIELMDWSEAQQLVLEGEADALIQINVTEERELLYDFSDPLLESEFSIFIPSDKPGITNMLDLRGLTVAAEAKGFSALILERDSLINIKPVPDLLSGFNMLLEGSVDAVVGDRWVGTYTLAENDIRGVTIANQPIDINYSSIAVRKGNTVLLAEINEALGEIKQDGTYQRIIDRWQAQEVIYQTIEQERQQRLIIAGSLAALLITVAFVLVLLYTVKKRKQVEQNLRKSENLFSSIFKHAPIGVALVSLEGRFLKTNQAMCDIFGYDHSDLMLMKVEDLSHPEDLERDHFKLKQLLNGETTSYRMEKRFYHKTGRIVWGLLNVTLIQGDTGAPQHISSHLVDLTERKQAEEALKESEEKHREILEAMEEGYYEVDLAGNLVFCNESFQKMTGYSYDELMGKSYKHFYNNSQEVFQVSNQIYKTGKPVKAIDWPAITKGGSKLHLELSIALRRDEEGRAIGFRGVVRDITERRQVDEKIRYLSFHDQLTGLYNRHYLEEEMQRLDTKRQLPISIIMADLNGLKLVNDTYGHHTGDEMLKNAAEILKKLCREDDLLSRFGGDEFVLYLPRTPEKEAQKICNRIEKACRKELINDVPLSLSTGVAVKVYAEQKLLDVLGEAEDNMYRDKLTESRSGKSAVVNSLLQTLTEKSFETEAHTRNMQEAAKSIGEKLGLPISELHRLSLLITLHDIGKINIPEELLNKKESLSAAEWEIMKKHSETGYRIAKATDNFAHVAEDILAHHERWDGSGYPQGLKMEAIPMLARITAIADAYEVMSNGRPYKKTMNKNEIIAEFRRCSGTQFDPELVELFLSELL